MTAVAARVFAGHTDKPASEELDRRAVLVDRLDRNRRVGGNLEERGTVLFDGNVSEKAFDIPAALNADRLVTAGVKIREVIREEFEADDFAARNVFRP